MNISKPKLVPTLICFAIVGLVAATLPYPTLVNNLSVTDASTAE